MKYTAISVNFDSLGEAYGFPEDYLDPTFSIVIERFLEIANKYNIKLSFFIIGKDLLKKENRDSIRKIHSLGHEIGNHSWSHPQNFGNLKYSEIYKEVALTDYIIRQTTGSKPRGFIAPSWNTSNKLSKVLNKLEYKYDHSFAPSWLITVSVLKNLYNHIGSEKFRYIVQREDWLIHLFGNRNPQKIGKLLELPLPTNNLRIACWHTLCFMFGWDIFETILRSCLNQTDCFYYLVHPADLIDKKDLLNDRTLYLDRLEVSLEEKIKSMEKAIKIIKESGREIVTMNELANYYNIETL
jgi:hypothetical protein